MPTSERPLPRIDPPGHISAAGIIGKPIDFKWNDDDVSDYVDRESPQLEDLIEPLSLKACLAFAAGITEWIMWRLDGAGEFPDVPLFVEAVWAGVADVRYADEWELADDQDISGPGLAPRREAVLILDGVFESIRDLSNPVGEVCQLAFLAQHVLKGNKAYKSWLAQAAQRLLALSPMSERAHALFCEELDWEESDYGSTHHGEPVARALLDTSVTFEPERNHELIDAYLRKLEPARNRYLRTAKVLRADGFEGTPYRFPAE